jgi:hypothetical protein
MRKRTTLLRDTPSETQRIAEESRKRVAERDAEALRLRLAGHTYAAIAEMLDYAGAPHAQKQIAKCLSEITREPAKELQELELKRLDEMFIPAYTRAIEGGGPKAIQSCLHIMERRARLLGLDRPTKIATTTPEGEALPPPVLDLATLTDDELKTLEQLLSKSSRAPDPAPASPSAE